MRNIKRKNSGFTIVEMLLALTITALLMTALAASINASVVNVTANEDSYKAINNARQALSRICAQVRTCDKVYTILDSSNWCMIDVDNDVDGVDLVSFVYASDKGILYLVDDFDEWFVLCEGVEDMTFTKGFNSDGEVRNVQISMTITAGNVTKKLSTAAVVMRKMP